MTHVVTVCHFHDPRPPRVTIEFMGAGCIALAELNDRHITLLPHNIAVYIVIYSSVRFLYKFGFTDSANSEPRPWDLHVSEILNRARLRPDRSKADPSGTFSV